MDCQDMPSQRRSGSFAVDFTHGGCIVLNERAHAYAAGDIDGPRLFITKKSLGRASCTSKFANGTGPPHFRFRSYPAKILLFDVRRNPEA